MANKKQTKKSNAKASSQSSSSRPKPSSPRAGFRVDGNRYGCGGKLK